MILESAALAVSLRQADHVSATLAACSRITCAVVGIGAWRPGQSSLRSALPDQLVHALEDAGAAADMCSTVVDADGRVISSGDALQDRCISITTNQLRAIPDVVALAGGAAKASAIAAVARAGLVHRLITDSTAAQALLHLEGRTER
jgi:DNA-binding transcriptional regulator LsrR (DeoR family)